MSGKESRCFFLKEQLLKLTLNRYHLLRPCRFGVDLGISVFRTKRLIWKKGGKGDQRQFQEQGQCPQSRGSAPSRKFEESMVDEFAGMFQDSD